MSSQLNNYLCAASALVAGCCLGYAASQSQKRANEGPSTAPTPSALSAPSCAVDQEPAQFYLLLHNVTKKMNIGNIVRCAAAFGCKEIILVGNRRTKDIQFFGSQNAHKNITIRCFLYMAEAVKYVKGGCCDPFGDDESTDPDVPPKYNKCDIVGVEIMPDAHLLTDPNVFATSALDAVDENGNATSPKNVCFLPGNEGHGLSEQDKKFCDKFIYIPQFSGGTASLNVSSATSIVLYEFTKCAGYKECSRNGEKFVVAQRGTKGYAETRGDENEEEEEDEHTVNKWTPLLGGVSARMDRRKRTKGAGKEEVDFEGVDVPEALQDFF